MAAYGCIFVQFLNFSTYRNKRGEHYKTTEVKELSIIREAVLKVFLFVCSIKI